MDKVDKLLMKVGVPPHAKGYGHIKTALKLLEKDPTYIDELTKRLYPAVAEERGTSSRGVERGIRHGVESAFDRMPPELQEEMFGNIINAGKGKATNGEFLAVMVLHLEDEV